VHLDRPVLLTAALLAALVTGPWLARAAVRLSTGEDTARGGPVRAVGTTLVLGVLLAGAVLATGDRPALLALGWAAGATVLLGSVDLVVHRLPDRVTYPALVVCATALVVDAAVCGSWGALLRALLAAVAAAAPAALGWVLSPAGIGLGDVKLLALLGLVLGWFGWGALVAGLFLGLVVGSAVALALMAAGRAGLRTAVPFGPPLFAGAVLALLLVGPVPVG
jgi:leader peptidase (prepilin peptidase)/N-methyltransferase